MVKFGGYEINIEIEKLKIHVKGDRQIAPEIANNVANQISAVFQPAALVEGAPESQNGHQVIDAASAPAPAKRRGRRAAGTKSSSSDGNGAVPVDWNHDVKKWGTPLQTWSQPQKITWLLYVVEHEGVGKGGLTHAEMADIFQRKFKAAGLLTITNIRRDLNKKPELFGALEGRWYLKEVGKREAAKLVAEAKGQTVTT